MKLIFCPECQDIVKLQLEEYKTPHTLDRKSYRYCSCGNSWGRYTDNENAVIGGKAIPLGINNRDFLSSWARLNNLKNPTFSELEFNSFFIKMPCHTIKQE